MENEVKTAEVVKTKYAQGLVDDIFALRQNFGEMENIIRDILVFLANKYERDLFGYIRFDIKEFADTLGYKTSSLQKDYIKKISKDGNMKLQIPSLYNGHKWDSYIEYALLYMLRTNFIWSSDYRGKIKMESYQLLSELIVEKGPRDKRMYSVKLGYFTSTSFFKEYINIDYSKYIQIQKMAARINGSTSMTNLYLYLMKGYRSCCYDSSYIFSTTVDILSELMDYNITEDNHRDRKRRIKAALDKMVVMLDNIGFSYSFEKAAPDSRFKYKVCFKFDDQKLLYSNLSYHKFSTTIRNKCEMAFLEKYHSAFYNRYKKGYGSFAEIHESASIPASISEEFSRWYTSSEDDLELKQKQIADSIAVCFKHIATKHNIAELIQVINNNYYSESIIFDCNKLFLSLERSEAKLTMETEHQIKLMHQTASVSKDMFKAYVVDNNLSTIKDLIEKHNISYHISDQSYLTTAFSHGNYKICEYLIENGASISKSFLDMVEAKKTKHAKELYNFIIEFKNNNAQIDN